MEPGTDVRRVLVIGAGAAGLLIAQVLKKHGVPCTVFEQDTKADARPRDWNYGIYWAQSYLAECLPPELVSQLESAQVDSHTPSGSDILPTFNLATGEPLISVSAPYSYRLQRRKFLNLISTGIDIQYGKRLTMVDSDNKTVTAVFEDSSQATGNLLIGTEGAHSRVREYLLGKERAAVIPSRIVASATVSRLPEREVSALRKLHPRYCIAIHPDGYFNWLGIHDEAAQSKDCTFMIILSWISESDTGLSGTAIAADLKERANTFGEPFRTVLQSIPSETTFWHNRLSSWPTQPWNSHNGTVTLAGDAAHPMTFHRGQGLNNAITDAAYFGRQLAALDTKSTESLSAVVTAFEEELWKRGNEAVTQSDINSLSVHNWEELKSSPLFTSGLKQRSST
ncbi:hypothetical protein PISL3812_02618 [Talaromyces islandicus]|uniref:FAD-dependent monooxygenase cctM n=1 Tax=Talaromyces islandicus TaxID=28573 RepID=CCTM_TALIS|nr:RecName: Full=FAD-dependent monooxygenase cctM; AltName: Full=Cyclochlorotine biosynthesis protein M; Flags: Precursor [Talaromyces islandicus]CRG85571.1 hypothetical protein PISL3812_02618 [Talaromyces islandicus]